jgi:hypothetical protein
VSALFASEIPDALGGIKFWGIRRQLENLEISTVLLEEVPELLIFVIRSIILDEINPMVFFVK